jgi:pSer/pThr/pTyr-binding forkhead associated (FHA) protein
LTRDSALDSPGFLWFNKPFSFAEMGIFMRAQLVPLDGGPPVDIVKDMMLVGRQEDCDLRLDHKSVSKIHCVLVKTDGLILLRDLGSTNGTRVNGTRVRRGALLPNDKLSVANFHYKVLFGAALTAAAAVVATDQTQQIEPEQLNKLIADEALIDSEPDVPLLKVQQNSLPDVYPEPKK